MEKKVSRKTIKEEAARLRAIKVTSDIYNYENIISYICGASYRGNLENVPNSYKEIVSKVLEECKEAFPKADYFTNTNCLYSCGMYGNTGRLDYICPVYESLGIVGACPAAYIYY